MLNSYLQTEAFEWKRDCAIFLKLQILHAGQDHFKKHL